MKNWIKMVIMLVICVVLSLAALMMNKGSEFGGADGAAEDVIIDIAPDTKPWIESVIELPGSETESLLFALQAALGAGAIGFGFGYLVRRSMEKRD